MRVCQQFVRPVETKSEDQQAILALHRMLSQWMATPTARINALRRLLRETPTRACS
jgi:hypothetical protein